MEEEAPKKPGGLLLTLILLGVIGYSGYRVYPPLLDLWQRAREPAEAPAIPPKAESAPQTSNPDNSNAKPDAQSNDDGAVCGAGAGSRCRASGKFRPEGCVAANGRAPPLPLKAPEPAPAAAGSADKSIAPQKPAAPAGPSPAHLLESKLRAELAGQPLADKVTIQATANALTLSGSLTLAEHRELWTTCVRFLPAFE